MNDGLVDGMSAAVTIEVTSGNAAPSAVDDAYSLTENTTLTINGVQGVLINDSDPEGGPLTVTLDSGPQFGLLDLVNDGSFTYTPNTDYTGSDSFIYTVSDGNSTSNIAAVTFTINAAPTNTAPVANDELYVVGLDTQLVVPVAAGLLANDSDADSDPLSVVLVNGPSHGTLNLAGDGSFTFDPQSFDSGIDTFTYRADDGSDQSNLATVTLEIGLPPLSVDGLGLVQDTGASSSDLLTWDPRITGMVNGGFGNGSVDVEFDHDGDGTAEGVLSFATSGQSFVYNPLRHDPSLIGDTGTLPLTYRFVKRDAAGQVQSTEAWQSFSYDLEAPPAVDGLTLEDFGLWLDTGTLDYDRNSMHPTVAGTLAGTIATGSARVEFDHDGDGIVDGQVELAVSGETFQYDPWESDPSLVGFLGDLVLDFRLVRRDAAGAVTETGPWVVYDLTVTAPPPSPDTITNLALVNDTQGGLVTWDPTLTGEVNGGQSQSYRPVELDLDGDGVANFTTRTGTIADSIGNVFTATPSGLAYGNITIAARALEWSTDYQTYLAGSWETFSFELIPEPAPEVTELALELDTGESESDGITTATTLIGQTDAPEGTILRIDLDHDSDGVVDGTVWTDTSGGFRYRPQGLPAGNVTISARVARYDAQLGADVLGSWFSVSFTYNGVVAPPVSELALANDTGTDTEDSITTDPTLTGQLTGEDIAYVTVEFDHDGDGVVDGQTVSDWSGGFTYYVAGLTAGAVTVKARSAVQDYQQDTRVTSDWVSLSFTKEATTHTNFSISDLTLLNDTGVDENDLMTYDRRVTGNLGEADGSDYIIVEFDHDGDGVVDGSTRTDSWGHFVYYASGLGLGSVTLSARTKEWNLGNRVASYGDWTSLSFTLEAETNAAPEVDLLELRADTGGSQTDLITANPLLFGRITNDNGFDGTAVEFDLDGDGVVDEWAFPDDNGEFIFRPEPLSLGGNTVSARSSEWDPLTQTEIAGTWQSLTFTLEEQPDAAPVFATLELALDPGDVTDDGITSNPSVTGRVLNEGALGGVTIEVDTDGDGTADLVTVTDDRGEFTIRPAELTEGTVTYQVRTQEVDPLTGGVITGGWSNFSFTYEVPVNTPAEVSQLSLVEDTGALPDDRITYNAAITGEITNEEDFAGLTVQFDHNGDGLVDGTTVTDENGQFTYAPAGLQAGSQTIAARAEEPGDGVSLLHAGWVTITFTLEHAPRTDLRIESLQLDDDTGVSATDRVTANPAVTGQIAGEESLSGITIQFDHNSDGVVDGATTTDGNGQFGYTPSGISEGIIPLRARTFIESADGTQTVSHWYLCAYVYSNDPDGAEAQTQRMELEDYETEAEDARTIYEQALETAEQTFQTDWQNAETTYQSVLESATTTRNDALSGAQTGPAVTLRALRMMGNFPNLLRFVTPSLEKFPWISTEEKRWWSRLGSVLRKFSRILNLWKILVARSINVIRWRVC